jgi:hypothetical protein
MRITLEVFGPIESLYLRVLHQELFVFRFTIFVQGSNFSPVATPVNWMDDQNFRSDLPSQTSYEAVEGGETASKNIPRWTVPTVLE